MVSKPSLLWKPEWRKLQKHWHALKQDTQPLTVLLELLRGQQEKMSGAAPSVKVWNRMNVEQCEAEKLPGVQSSLLEGINV